MGRSLLQLSEVLNGTNHLAGVGVLVVVPRNDLNLIGVVVDLSDHGLGGIEQGAVLHADNVRRNDRILVVAEALGSSSLHSSVDSFLGDVLALNDSNQDGGGAGGNGNTLSGADQLAVQFGDNQADSLGSAGGVRNDVLSTSTSAAQVALTLRAVQDHLVAGVSMNGGHDAGNDRESLVQGVGHRSQAVGGAGSSRDNLVILGQGLLVDRVDDGLQVVAGRSRDNDLLSASSDVSHALLFAGVEAGALQNNVNADLAPRAILSVLNGVDLDLLAIDDDGILGSFDGVLVLTDLAQERALSGVVLEQVSQHLGAFKQYIRLYEGSRADRIDFYNEVDWQLSNALLKAEFPLNMANTEATYDLGLGSVRRGNNTETAYEVYAQYWADLTDRSGNYGISVLNDSKYGWDKPDDNTLRLTLLHTPETDKDYAYQNRQDFGHHCFTYSLVGHAGGLDKAVTIEKAEILNQKLKAFRTDKHRGTLGKEFSFVSSNNRNVIIKALKKAENSDEYVVRVYEIGGEKVQDAVLSFAGEIASAYEADGTEKSIGSAEFSGNGLSVSIKPYSIKTFKVRLKSSGEDAYQLQYASLPLSYNCKCSSFNEFRGEADFESGYSFAAELLPESLTVNGIPFQLGEKDAANGMTCNGDTIVLPEGKKYNKLYFLAAATDGDYAATFRCGGNKSEVIVPSYTGFVGQWGHSGHTKGYLKDAEVAYVGTHRHSPTADEAYEFTYMFKFGVDIPAGAASLILPKNEKVVLFAATLVEETLKPVQVATSLFHTAIRDNEMELNSVEVEKENLLKGAKIIAYSGYFNDNEKPERIVDGDVDTKWCEVGSALNYVDFDLGEAKTVSGWKLVNAGREDKGYITSACFLQGRNSQTEEWKTLDNIDGNRQNVVSRMIDTPAQVRYVRLMITRPMQHAGGRVLRINEVELY